ncbi:hypothetical protein [Bacillus suaedae]|uniref:Lipoprotein n=1 Tax=Halalkalibacter suaedae TaxID=2822140 RepID=A0A940WW86_9BACI|nr:hypothetical protein [Bacillus suaedae]MBP3951637.1 hypothetical protein [Bacillus suaedae]
MKKINLIILFILSLYILTGCQNANPNITVEEAETIVVEKHTVDIGEVEIVSISHKRGKYIVEWENTDNCENGVDHIDDQSGGYIKGETTIC